ncbi:MAG: hypothetical protein R3C53_19020 [Pirellulaceae bacterium]
MSKLEERTKAWASREFWNRPAGQAYELFEITSDNSFEIRQGSAITAVNLVTMDGDESEPTGVVLEFDLGTRLWSAPAAHGNQVSVDSKSFFWPSEIELMPLA